MSISFFSVGGIQTEGVGEGPGRELREIRLRQALQAETGPAGGDRHGVAVIVGAQHDFRAVRQLAHDLIEQMRRHRGSAGLLHLGRCRLGYFQIQVGRLQFQALAFRARA